MLYSDLIKIHREMEEKKLVGKTIDGIQYNLLPYGWKYQNIGVIAKITMDGKFIDCGLYGIGKNKRKKSSDGNDSKSKSGDEMLHETLKKAVPYWMNSITRTDAVPYPVSDQMKYLSQSLSEKHYKKYIEALEKLLEDFPKSIYLKSIFRYLSNRKNDIFAEVREMAKERNVSAPKEVLEKAVVYFEVLTEGIGDGRPLTLEHDVDEDGNALNFMKEFSKLFVQRECMISENREKTMEKFPKLDFMKNSLIGKPTDKNLNDVEVCGYTLEKDDLTKNLNFTVKEGLNLIQTLSWLGNNFNVVRYMEGKLTKYLICWTDAEIENILENKADKKDTVPSPSPEPESGEKAKTEDDPLKFIFDVDIDLSSLDKEFDAKSDDDPPIDISEMSKIIRAFRGKMIDGELKGNTHILILGDREKGRSYIEYYNIISNTRLANNIKRWVSCMQGIRLMEKCMSFSRLTWRLLPFTLSEANKNEKLMSRFFSLRKRLLLCMLENRPLPQEVFRLGYDKVRKLILGGIPKDSNAEIHRKSINYLLSFLFFLNKFDALQQKDKKKMDALKRLAKEIQTEEESNMEDINSIHDRDFLWGRIYALIVAVEEKAMPTGSVGRLTHAEKRLDAFRRNPRDTYDSLYGKILPYVKKLQKNNAGTWDGDGYPLLSVLDKVNTMFETLEDASSTKSVGKAFISGLHVQREKISSWEYAKKKGKDKKAEQG